MNKWIVSLVFILFSFSTKAQFREANVHVGEYGIMVGAAHYFGDLNSNTSLNRPKIAFGALFRKQFGNYIALRLQGTFAQLGYSDIYSDNEVNRIRNLSFNTNVVEIAVTGDFNFFKFIPGDRDFRFTPYATLGVGFMAFNPYAYLNGQKYFLPELGTEGQGSSLYPERKPYKKTAVVFPLGFGVKYNLSPKTNLNFEITHRFTNSDYIDDVSTSYAGLDAFVPLANGDFSPAMLLQDRSNEVANVPIGIAGRQRGLSPRNDQYVIASLGITFNLMSYVCPPTKWRN